MSLWLCLLLGLAVEAICVVICLVIDWIRTDAPEWVKVVIMFVVTGLLAGVLAWLIFGRTI